MNFNIYVDKQTGERLERLAKRRRTSRNKLVREALSHFIERESTAGWPEAVLDFPGVEKAEPFEAHRRALKPARPDPFQ